VSAAAAGPAAADTSCVGRVERVLEAVPGVAKAVVNLTCVKF
jgi:hypothetical protein